MKTIRTAFFSLFFSWLLFSCSSKTSAPSLPLGSVAYITGQASVYRPSTGQWDTLGLNAPVAIGDSIKTEPESQVEIVFGDSNTIRVAEESKIFLADIPGSGDTGRSVLVFTCFGTVLSNISKLSGAYQGYRVETPTAVASIRGTFFAVSYELSTQNSEVHVFAGDVWVRRPRAATAAVVVGAGNFLRLELDRVPGPPQRLNFGQWKKMERYMHPHLQAKYNKLLFTERVEKKINLKDARQNLLKKNLAAKPPSKPGKSKMPAAPKSAHGKPGKTGKGKR